MHSAAEKSVGRRRQEEKRKRVLFSQKIEGQGPRKGTQRGALSGYEKTGKKSA